MTEKRSVSGVGLRSGEWRVDQATTTNALTRSWDVGRVAFKSMSEFYACGRCGKPVEPGDPATVAARRQIRNDSLAGGDDFIDGDGVYFHGRCYPGDRSGFWRRSD